MLKKRRCRICTKKKKLSEFYPRKGIPGSVRTACKNCEKEQQKALTRSRQHHAVVTNIRGEKWNPVVDYENTYLISDKGRVAHIRFGHKVLITKKPEKNGYTKIYLYKNGRYVRRYRHRMVAIAFIPNPLNKRYVNHKKIKNPCDDSATNLEWCTHYENIMHAVQNGRIPNKKATQPFTARKGKLVVKFTNARDASIYLNRHLSSISLALTGKAKTVNGFTLSYVK